METTEKIGCSHSDSTFAHGVRKCKDDRCMICNNGKWEEETIIYPDELMSPLS